jgi:hypothetical protein
MSDPNANTKQESVATATPTGVSATTTAQPSNATAEALASTGTESAPTTAADAAPVVPPVTEPTPTAAVVTVPIPPAATAEIIKLYRDLAGKAQAAEQAKNAFNEFLRAARMSLGIPVAEMWELLPDASAFKKSPTKPAVPQTPQTNQKG